MKNEGLERLVQSTAVTSVARKGGVFLVASQHLKHYTIGFFMEKKDAIVFLLWEGGVPFSD